MVNKKLQMQPINNERTAGFKNPNKDGVNSEGEFAMMTGDHNFSKQVLPYQIDDISSIEGGHDFNNFNYKNGL